MKRRIHSHQLSISGAGERHYFEINLPRECGTIAGIQSVITNWEPKANFSPLPFLLPKAGTLQLMGGEPADTFYCGDVDFWLGAVPDARTVKAPVLPPVGFQPWELVHRSEPVPLGIEPPPFLFGCYRDDLNRLQPALNLRYFLTILLYLDPPKNDH